MKSELWEGWGVLVSGAGKLKILVFVIVENVRWEEWSNRKQKYTWETGIMTELMILRSDEVNQE